MSRDSAYWGEVELVFHGDRVSDQEDGSVPEMDGDDGCTTV